MVVIANGRTEKLASGLVNPFLAHLKAAQDQIAKGGYSITLIPDCGKDATWFIKGTVERYVMIIYTSYAYQVHLLVDVCIIMDGITNRLSI